MTSGPPLASDAFDNWIAARLDEKVPVAFLAGLPTENDGLLQRLGIRRLSQKLKVKPSTETHDQALGAFEAPLVIRIRDLPALTVLDPARVAPALKLRATAGVRAGGDRRLGRLRPGALCAGGG